jgi:hypothetical protein
VHDTASVDAFEAMLRRAAFAPQQRWSHREGRFLLDAALAI